MKRTILQNSALHLSFEQFSTILNEAGLDQRKVLKPSVEIPWTKEAIKEKLFKPIMNAMYPEKTSTAELQSDEVTKVYETLSRHIGQTFGIHVPFPSLETLLLAKIVKEH